VKWWRAHTLTSEGKELKLLNLTQKISEILRITRLLTVFRVYEIERARTGCSCQLRLTG